MTTIHLTVTGAHVTAQADGPLTSGMVGLPVVISYDSSWDGLTKTLVCRSSMGMTAHDQVYILANIGTQATVAPEVMTAQRHLYLGIEGRTADGTLVVPTIWADCGAIQPGAESNGTESQEVTPEVWAMLASQIGPLEDLATPQKGNIVTAINALAQEAQASQEALVQEIQKAQNLGNQNSTNLTAAKKDLESAIQNVHNQLTSDIRAMEEEIAQLPAPEIPLEPGDGDLPRVYLEGTIPTDSEETQATLTYVSKTGNFSAYLVLHCADDASRNQEKKSFAIQMFSNAARTTKLNKSFRDWGYASNAYVLRANFTDHSHSRNIVSSRLWDQVMASRADYSALPPQLQDSPRNGASDGFPVKVYWDGTYQGIYTWNMAQERWNMSGMNQGVLRALTNSSAEQPETPCNFRTLWSGTSGDHWAMETGTGAALTASLNNLITFLLESDDDQFRSSIGRYLDVQSAMDYFLFQYAICGVDGMGKNLRLATYDGTKWFCGCGDLDATFLLNPSGGSFAPATCRCPKDYQESRSLLWARMEKTFHQEMKERYHELRPGVLSFANICNHFERFVDGIGKDAYQEDVEIFPSIPQSDTNNIQQIRNAIRDRLAYCDEAIENLGQEYLTGSIDYLLNPLADVAWQSGSCYVNGVLTSKSGEHCTEKFTLQDCLYQLTYSAGSTPTLYVWDQEGSYLGQVENQLNYFTGNSSYQYAFRISYSSAFDPGLVTIMPVNNEETARDPITLKLAEMNYSSDSLGIYSFVNSKFNLESVTADTIASKIHHADALITIGTTYTKPTDVDPDKLCVASFYPNSKKVTFGTRLYSNAAADAKAYFTEHDTTIHING